MTSLPGPVMRPPCHNEIPGRAAVGISKWVQCALGAESMRAAGRGRQVGRESLDDGSDGLRLTPARPGCPVLVYAISGLGKSTLAAQHPDTVLDADELLYAAVADAFPDLDPRARLSAWRDLCRRRPWEVGGEPLSLWARTRRAWVEPFVATMQGSRYRLVLTSLLDPPWVVAAYYGVERGRYLEHLRRVGRLADNEHSESMNDRLEGYAPLFRVRASAFLACRPELRILAEDAG